MVFAIVASVIQVKEPDTYTNPSHGLDKPSKRPIQTFQVTFS